MAAKSEPTLNAETAVKRHPVAVCDRADKDFNTILLEGMDVIIPLAEDLDCDPLQDDEIRLESLDGSFEKVLKASDPDAEPDHQRQVINYNFRKVPVGYYRIAVRVGESWVDVSNELMISPKGAFFLGSRLKKDPPEAKYQARIEERDAEEPATDDWGANLPDYMDLNESFRESR